MRETFTAGGVAAALPPSYLALVRSGELHRRAELLAQALRCCRLCPHRCGVDRFTGAQGVCSSGWQPIVSAYGPHWGEEPPLSGTHGAGNVFFGNCNLRCVYCQNHVISQNPQQEGRHETTTDALADIMLELQQRQCHNINLVSPSHFVAPIVQSICRGAEKGLAVPIVYNTNAYDGLGTLELLEGVVDVYLPDLKYHVEKHALDYSRVKGYPAAARRAIREMFRQVGPERIHDAHGMLRRGLIVRLLVLPHGLAGIDASLRFICEELSPQVAVSVMAQYYPTHLVGGDSRYALLEERVGAREWDAVMACLDKLGMENGWVQDPNEAPDSYRPDFENRRDPFRLPTTLTSFP
jgi:putative pyruvate formate lyase activating enzyme